MTSKNLDCSADASPTAIGRRATGSVSLRPLNYLDLRLAGYYDLAGVSERKVVMSTKSFLLPLALLTLLILSPETPCWGSVVTFDDLHETASGSFVANGYQGLNWNNFVAANGILGPTLYGTNGYYYGTVSASNVTYNGLGNPAEIDSRGTNFNFLSAYLTGAWHSNLNIEVQGLSGTTMLYDTTVVASATSPTMFAFNYLDIDRLTFNSFGGQSAFSNDGGNHFVMDNFTFELVPEPSTFLLAAFGGVSLVAFCKRKRA